MKLKQVKLLPMADRELERLVQLKKKLYPDKRITKQSLVNELILMAAIAER